MTSKIEQQVMASVGVIHTFRRLTSFTALKVYALALSLWSIGALVWVARVGENFMTALGGGVQQTAMYIFTAVTDTTVVVQLVLLVVLFALFSLAADLIRATSSQRSFA